MSEILLINPRRRRGRGGRFVKRSRARRRSVARVSRRRRRRNPMGAFMNAAVNPRRRRRHARVHSRRIGRRRRNPRFGGFSMGGILRQVVPAAVGGAGALGLDMAMAVIPLPDALRAGPLAIVTKAVGALAVGYLAGMVFGRENGRLVTLGGLTVVAYNAIRGVAQQVAPTLPGLSDYGLGAFMPGQLGFVDPAPVLRGMGQYEPPTSRDGTIGDIGCGDGM